MSDDLQSPPPAPPAVGTEGPSETGRLLGLLSYLIFLWPIPQIIALVMEPQKNEKWVRLHAIQGLAFGVVVWAATVVLFFLPGIPYVAGVVYGIILALRANKGEEFEVPVIYGLVKNYI